MALFRYIGAPLFLQGIPARDLQEPEFEALTDEQKALVRRGDVYVPADLSAGAAPEAQPASQPEPASEPEPAAAPESQPKEGDAHDDATQ